MSLPQEMDRLSITDEAGQEQETGDPNIESQSGGENEDGKGEVGEQMDRPESAAETPDPLSLRKFVSSSSLFDGDQHLFEFIDEPVSNSLPSPPSNLDQFETTVSGEEDRDGTPAALQKEDDEVDADVSACYKFLDRDRDSEKSVDSEDGVTSGTKEQEAEEKVVSETMNAPSPSIGRSTKGRAPPPPSRSKSVTMGPTDVCPGDCDMMNSGYADGSGNWQFSIPVPHKTHYHICPEFRSFDYMAHPSAKVRFYQVGYNTNLKKPTENWVRMKSRYHAKGGENSRRSLTSHSYSHYYGYEHNWLSYAFAPRPQVQNTKKYSVPSSWKSRKQFLSHFSTKGQAGMQNFDNSLCTCCVCCNCAKTNQTNCCCCYHCVHTVSACRRSDVLRMIPFPAEPSSTPGAIVSILKKKADSDTIRMHDPALLPELDQSHEQEYCPDTKPPLLPLETAEHEEEEERTDALLPTAPSPTASGPTPTTEPTELDMDETAGTMVQPVSA